MCFLNLCQCFAYFSMRLDHRYTFVVYCFCLQIICLPDLSAFGQTSVVVWRFVQCTVFLNLLSAAAMMSCLFLRLSRRLLAESLFLFQKSMTMLRFAFLERTPIQDLVDLFRMQ